MPEAPSRLALSRNATSIVGFALTTAAALVFIALFLLNIIGFLVNPYMGLLVYVALPLAFLFGLVLVPLGIWRQRRRLRRTARSSRHGRGSISTMRRNCAPRFSC